MSRTSNDEPLPDVPLAAFLAEGDRLDAIYWDLGRRARDLGIGRRAFDAHARRYYLTRGFRGDADRRDEEVTQLLRRGLPRGLVEEMLRSSGASREHARATIAAATTRVRRAPAGGWALWPPSPSMLVGLCVLVALALLLAVVGRELVRARDAERERESARLETARRCADLERDALARLAREEATLDISASERPDLGTCATYEVTRALRRVTRTLELLAETRTLFASRDLDAGRDLVRRVEQHVGPEHPAVAIVLAPVAALQAQSGDTEGAARSLSRAVELRRRTAATLSPNWLAYLDGMLVQGHFLLGRFDEVLALGRSLLTRRVTDPFGVSGKFVALLPMAAAAAIDGRIDEARWLVDAIDRTADELRTSLRDSAPATIRDDALAQYEARAGRYRAFARLALIELGHRLEDDDVAAIVEDLEASRARHPEDHRGAMLMLATSLLEESPRRAIELLGALGDLDDAPADERARILEALARAHVLAEEDHAAIRAWERARATWRDAGDNATAALGVIRARVGLARSYARTASTRELRAILGEEPDGVAGVANAIERAEEDPSLERSDVIDTLRAVATLELQLDDARGRGLLIPLVSLEDERLDDAVMRSDPSGQRLVAKDIARTNDLIVTMALAARAKDHRMARGVDVDAWQHLAVDVMLARQGRVARERHAVRPLTDDPTTLASWDELRARRAQLAGASILGLRAQEAGLALDTRRLELEVARLVVELERSRPRAHSVASATREQLAAALKTHPRRAALVGFAVYHPAPWALDARRAGAASMAAYVITHDGRTRWFSLGDKASLDEQVRLFRAAIARREDARAEGRALFDATLGRLDGIERADHLFIVSDGDLSLVPFGALTRPDGGYVIERHVVSHLVSPSDVVARPAIASRTAPLVVGDIDYGDSDAATPAAGRDGDALDRFGALHHTGLEVTEVARALERSAPRILRDTAATETALAGLARGPAVLHIATHGFYLDRRRAPIEDPLLRAGLALAGANQGGDGGRGDDGILTALEATSLDLVGTELVVLSACETGLGDVAIGDGVRGLQAAFFEAGAETVVSSLWPVDDGGTADLMTAYYERLAGGADRVAAMREIQLAWSRAAQANERPGRERLASAAPRREAGPDIGRRAPYYWAPFVVTGRPGALRVASPTPR